MLKSCSLLILAALLAYLLPSCGDSAPTPPTTSKTEFKIGLIVMGSTSDGGWNQAARQALAKLETQPPAQGAIKVSVREKVDQSKASGEMRDYAANGYDLVIGHGFEYAVPAIEVAKGQAKTKFVVSGYPKSEPDIMTLDFDLAPACYQLGILAAGVSKTGKIGFIGGSAIPSLVACYKGFAAGAKSANPNIIVVKAYTRWDRPELSKSQTETFIQQNVDVIFQNVDAASRGVFEAVSEANAAADRGDRPTVYVFGSNSNQNDNIICPEYTLASAVIHLDDAFGNVIKAIQDGKFTPGVVSETLSNGICTTEINPKLVTSGVISKETLAKTTEAGKKLASGQLKIPTSQN